MMKTTFLAAAIVLLVSQSAAAQERQLRQFLASGSPAAGIQYCEETLPLELAKRPDPRGISPELLTRLALLCDALATAAGREEAAGWWWYTATNLHADTQAIFESLKKEGIQIAVPPPRKFGGSVTNESGPQQVRLMSGELVAGTPPRLLKPPAPPDYITRHTPGVFATRIEVELVVDHNGVPHQPLLAKANGWPLHVFYAFQYLHSWRFEPARVDGKPVDSIFRVSVSTGSGGG